MEHAISIKQNNNSTQENTVIHVENLEHRKQIINNNKIVIIKYSADWCGPCKKIQPLYEELCKEKENCVFLSEDVDDEIEDLGCEITYIPVFHIYKNGKFDQAIGGDLQQLQTIINDFENIKE